ncbi:MAG: beta strand repeat-containing protein, partial [Candidatus Saccharimonadales bacterium]
LLQNNVNSVSALAIQNANGTQVAAVDTTNGQLILGSYNSGSNPVNGSLAFANTANANTITLQSPTGINAPSGNVVFTLPKTVGTSGQCLKATDGSGGLGFVDCVGGGGGGGSTAVTTLNGLSGDVILQDSNSRITITTPDSTHINITIPQSVATSATPTFAGETLTGALTQSGGTAQINVSGTSNTSIGNSTGTLQLQSNTFNVSTAGAITGVTGYTQSSGNFSQIGVGSFSTGTGTVSLNGATTVSSTLTVQGSNALTLGLTGTNTGAIVLRGATAASGTLTIQGLSNPSTSNYKISFPTVASDDTFCLLTAQNCAGSGVNLQVAYNGSGATDPQIKVTSANGGVKIQDADTTISGNLFTVKGSSATGANALFNVSSTGNVTIQNTAGSQFFNLDATNALISLNGANPGGLSTSPGWQSATALGTANYANYSVAVRGYLYAIGGVNNSSAVNYAKINADGSIGSWTGTTSLGGNCSNSLGTNAPTTYNGYIYVLCSGSANGYYGRPNADGTVSLWTAFTMPSSSLSLFSSVMVSGYLYVIGGQSGGVSQSAVYYAQINNDGSVGSFASTTALGSPTTAENSTAATVVNGYIYVIGGSTTASGGNVVQNVFYAKPASNGVIPSWAATTQLPAPGLRAAAAIGSNGYIYVLGGSTTSASTSKSTTVYYGKPSSTGTVPSWSTTTALGTAIDGEAVAQYNGYIYTVGGAASSNVAQTGVKYISGERVQIAGSLDLVGLSGSNLADTGGSSGGSLTAGNTNIVGNLNVQGGAGFAQSVAIAGGLGVTGNTYLQNGSGTNLLASDITNNKITIGSPTTYTFASLSLYAATAQITGTTVIGAYVSSTCYDATAGNGYVIFSSTSSNPYEPMLCGTARHTKTISLAPEYAGAVLYPDGSNNSGTMTTGFDGTNFHTYYKWTTSQGTNQDFDIIVRVPVPSGYSSLPTGAQYCVNTYSSDLSNGTITGIMYDSSGNPQSSANLTPTNIGAGGAGPGAWQQVCSNNIGGTITAGGYITFRLKMQSPTSGDVRLGELSFNYMSSF